MWLIITRGMNNFLQDVAVTTNLPIRYETEQGFIQDYAKAIIRWKNKASAQWKHRITATKEISTGPLTGPMVPQLNDSKATMQFINWESVPAKLRNNPFISTTGHDIANRVRHERMKNKYPTNYYEIPPWSRFGASNRITRGTGVAVSKSGLLSTQRPEEDIQLERHVHWDPQIPPHITKSYVNNEEDCGISTHIQTIQLRK